MTPIPVSWPPYHSTALRRVTDHDMPAGSGTMIATCHDESGRLCGVVRLADGFIAVPLANLRAAQ